MLYPNDELLIKVYLREQKPEVLPGSSRRSIILTLWAWLTSPIGKSAARTRLGDTRSTSHEALEVTRP